MLTKHELHRAWTAHGSPCGSTHWRTRARRARRPRGPGASWALGAGARARNQNIIIIILVPRPSTHETNLLLLLEKGGDWKRKSKSGSLPIDVALSLTSQKKVRCAEVLRQWNEHNGRPQKKKQAKPEDSRWGYHYIPPTDHTGRTSRDRTSGWDDEWEKEKLRAQEKKKSKSKK